MNLEKEQFSIWWVDLGKRNHKGHEQEGIRPFFIISNTKYNKKSKTPIGFICSSREKDFSVSINIKDVDSYVNVSQIRTLSEERFDKIKHSVDNNLKDVGDQVMDKFKKMIINDLN
jgi:mRNA-degrading endonuclease toxin of MazEF toxin-antitoxin module